MILRWLSCLLLSFFCSQAFAVSLLELFEAAKGKNADFKNQKITHQQSKLNVRSAFGELLPTLSISSSSVWREAIDAGGVARSFGETHQHDSELSLRQPLFQGGGEYYGYKAMQYLEARAGHAVKVVAQGLYLSVGLRFLAIKKVESDIDNWREQVALLKKRLRLLQHRAKIGRSKKTEVLAAQSQMSKLQAELIGLKSQWIQQRAELQRLTGLDESVTLDPPPALKDLNIMPDWEGRLGQLPEVKENEALLLVAKNQLKATYGGYLPKVDIEGNYYLERSGILSGSQWDVTLNARWELYSGGKDIQQTRSSQLEILKRENTLVEFKKDLMTSFESKARELESKKSEVESLKQAVAAAQMNYQQHSKEFQSGLVSNLDVLRALDDLLGVKRSYTQALFEARMKWIEFNALLGEFR